MEEVRDRSSDGSKIPSSRTEEELTEKWCKFESCSAQNGVAVWILRLLARVAERSTRCRTGSVRLDHRAVQVQVLALALRI